MPDHDSPDPKMSEQHKPDDAAATAAADAPAAAHETETHAFQAEARQLLHLVVHALYSHKDIFLRELISNASDALDRLRFESLTSPELLGDDEKLQIRLEVDRDARTLTIHDNGIGMSRTEAVENLGTIARSGTRELIEKLKQSKKNADSPELIGQFGVGFYSAFMAADRVVVVTQRAGDDHATRWESTGEGAFTIADAERAAGRGTSITLHLRPADSEDGMEDFTDRWVLKRVVTRYSDFVTYPVILPVEKTEGEGDSAKTRIEDETLNSMKAIWTRPASDVEDQEYEEFYKHISHDWTAPLKRITVAAEGTFEYRALVFIPARAAFDMYYPEAKPGLQLYVKRVKIDEHCEHLVPRYLRFVKGVVDAPDLSLNVSREMLQHDRRIAQIQKRLTRKILDALSELADKEPDDYLKFWRELGPALKEGIATDTENRDRLRKLLLFPSSHDSDKLTSLGDYIGRMPEAQKEIYYLTGPSKAVVESSPHLEALRDKGFEVLFLVEPIDELVVQHVTDVDGKKLRSANLGEVELDADADDEKSDEERKAKVKEHASMLDLMQRTLQEHIKEVRLSSRLKSSPACLVGSEDDMSPQLERMLRQAQRTELPKQKRILELNPDHEILAAMKKRFDVDRSDPVLSEYAELLYGQALLAEGSELPNPARFSKLIAELMVRSG